MPIGLPSHKPSRPIFSLFKILGATLGSLVLLILIFALCLPLLLSTSTGKQILLTLISKQADMTLAIEELHLSWFGTQSVKGMRCLKPQEQLSLSCTEITTDASLFNIVFAKHLGDLKIHSPNLQLAKPFVSSSSHYKPHTPPIKPHIQAAGFAATPSLELALSELRLPVTSGSITIEGGEVSLNPPGLDQVRFEHLSLLLDMTHPNALDLNLHCLTCQQDLQGQIALQGKILELGSSFPNLSILSTLSNLPVRGIDQIVSLFAPQLQGLSFAALGAVVDMQCSLHVLSGSCDLSLSANSPLMSAKIVTQTVGGILSLKEVASLNITLTPAVFTKLKALFPALAELQLTQPTPLQATLQQFCCPMPLQVGDLLKAAFEANFSALTPLAFSLDGKPFVISQLQIKSSSALLEKQLDVHASLQAQQGTIHINGKIDQPFSRSPQGTFALDTLAFPLDCIPSLATHLGPTADIHAAVTLGGSTPKLDLSWHSAFLSLPTLTLSLGDPFTLLSPSAFTFTLNPALGKADPIQGTLESLSLPLSNIKNAQVSAKIATGQLALLDGSALHIAHLSAQLSINTLDKIALNIEGEPLQASLFGAFNSATSEFSLTKPFLLQCTLDDAMRQALAPSAPELLKPCTVQLSVDPFTARIATIDKGGLSLKGQLSSADVALGIQGKQIALQNTSLPFQWNGKAKEVAIQLTSEVQNPTGDAGSMQGQCTLSHFMDAKGLTLNTAAIRGALDLQNISSALLDAFEGSPLLSSVIGPSFSSKLKVESLIDKQSVSLKWISPNLTVDSSFIIDKEAIELQGPPSQITWTLTPESYKILDRRLTGPTKELVPFEIKEPSTFTLSLTKLVLPVIAKEEVALLQDRLPNSAFDIEHVQLSGSGHNASLSFFEKNSKESIQFSNLSFTLNKGGDGAALSASLESSVVTQHGAASTKNGSLSIKGQLEQTLDDKGHFDLSNLSCGLQMKIQQLPSAALDIAARAYGRSNFPFTTLFGEMINASLSLNLKNFNGPLTCTLNTPRARAELNGHLVKGALLLNDAIYAQMQITPEMSRLILKEVNPLNLSYLYSQAPITLEIPAEGFYLPFYPLNLGKIAIPDATIELGKISCRNEGNINIALSLLKAKQFDKKGELSLWFAPIDLSVKQGIVAIDRTEILLADTFDVCLWGKVDLLKNYVDMMLGLTAQTLAQAFGIKNLPKDYVLTIPMKGEADNVQINTSKATAKVALLLAWQNKDALGALGGGPTGAIVGEFLGKVATLPDSKAKIPPAKHPFPWEIGKGGKTSQTSSHKKKREFKADDKPLKQILKVIR